MAVTCLSADQLSQHDFLQDAELDGSEFVSKHKRKTIFFFDPAGASWMVGDLEDTIYSGKENVVNGWNKFYLPDIVNMQVMGVVKGTSCLCDQLVLMTCEDRKLYAYDGDELHLVASSLKQLILLGMEYPAAKSYHKGEAFRNMTDKDWDQVRRYDVGKCLDKEHHELVMTNDSHFLKNLSSIRPTTGDKRARMATVACLPTNQIIRASVRDEELEGSEFVSKHKSKIYPLKSPAGATWTVGDLEDTIYSGKENVVNGWNKFYLPDIVNMQVMGVVKGTSCECDQLVLMTCEDGQLYAYDGDELHLVASSLKQLIDDGMEYPAAKSYDKGEAFENTTDKDWDEVRGGDVGKRLDKEHHELVMAKV